MSHTEVALGIRLFRPRLPVTCGRALVADRRRWALSNPRLGSVCLDPDSKSSAVEGRLSTVLRSWAYPQPCESTPVGPQGRAPTGPHRPSGFFVVLAAGEALSEASGSGRGSPSRRYAAHVRPIGLDLSNGV